jgi:hypothetical protein
MTEQTFRAPGGQPVQQDLYPPSNADWHLENAQFVGDWIYLVWSKLESSVTDAPPG